MDFATSTSVSGDWRGIAYEVKDADTEAACAVLAVLVVDDLRLHEKLGEPEARTFIDRCIKRVTHAAESFGGRVAEVGHVEVIADIYSADDALKSALEILRPSANHPPKTKNKLK